MDDLTTAGPTPAQILGDRLTLQLHAHEGVITAGPDGPVECWDDVRPGGLSATQPDADARPLLVPHAYDTRPAIRFTTENAHPEACFLALADDPRLNPGTGPLRILLVARNRTMENPEPPNTLLHKDGAYAVTFERLGDASMGTRFTVNSEEPLTHAETTALNLGALHLYELILTGDELTAAIDGTAVEGSTTYTGPVSSAGPLCLGGVNRGIDLFTVLVIKGETTTQELTSVHHYLTESYPIPVTPPALTPAGDELTGMISVNEGGRARIPAIVRCDDDSLVIFAEHRWDGDADSGHISTVARRSTDAGVTWGEQTTVVDDGENCLGNPVPVVDRATGRLHLLLTGNRAGDTEAEINAGTAQDTRRVYRTFSDDHGVTWAPLVEITDSVKDPSWRWYATGPGGAEQLASGRLLVSSNHWDPAVGAYRSHAVYSDDGGENWLIGGIVAVDRTNEIQTAQLPDGTLVAHIRYNLDNNPPGWKYWDTSDDEGETWNGAARNYSLPSTPVQDDILVLPDGRLVATNHQDFTGRYHLAVNVSPDAGRTWPAYTVIRVGAVGNGAAYSDLVHVSGDRIAAIWEAGRQISVQLFDVVYPV